jgi:hypothetical protein
MALDPGIINLEKFIIREWVCRDHILIGQSDYVSHNSDYLIGVVCFACQGAAEWKQGFVFRRLRMSF